MANLDAIWREDATEWEQVGAYQSLINTGAAWTMEGHTGRTAMDLIEAGLCALGHSDHNDYWGNHIPSRTQVEEGTKGSVQYVHDCGYEVQE